MGNGARSTAVGRSLGADLGSLEDGQPRVRATAPRSTPCRGRQRVIIEAYNPGAMNSPGRPSWLGARVRRRHESRPSAPKLSADHPSSCGCDRSKTTIRRPCHAAQPHRPTANAEAIRFDSRLYETITEPTGNIENRSRNATPPHVPFDARCEQLRHRYSFAVCINLPMRTTSRARLGSPQFPHFRTSAFIALG